MSPLASSASSFVAEQDRRARQRAKRPAALRRAERDLAAIRESLKSVGYQAGDEVYHRINDAIGAVESDLNAA